MSVALRGSPTQSFVNVLTSSVSQKLTDLFSDGTNLDYRIIWDEITPPLKPDFCDKSIPGKCFYLVESVYNYAFKVGVDTAGQVYVKATSHNYDPVIYNKLKACVVDNAGAVANLIIKASAGDDRSSSTDRSPYSLFSSSPAGSNVEAYLSTSDLTSSEESLVRTGFNALVEQCLHPTPDPSPTPPPCTSAYRCTLGNVGGGFVIAASIILAGLGLKYCWNQYQNKKLASPERYHLLKDIKVINREEKQRELSTLCGQISAKITAAIPHIDNYDIKKPTERKEAFDDNLGTAEEKQDLLTNSEKVKRIFSPAGLDILHGKEVDAEDEVDIGIESKSDAEDEVDIGNSTEIRTDFATKLAARLISPEKVAKLLNHERGQTIKLEELIGKKLTKLYKKAIKEEQSSLNFRDAVGVASSTTIDVPWTKSMHLIVSGASGSGKSYGAEKIIDELKTNQDVNTFMTHAPQYRQDPITTFVSADGGIERNLSQIRKLVLQMALILGYTGIEDLHELSSGLKMKKIIQKAAFASPVHLIEPLTFTMGQFDAEYKKIAKAVSHFMIFGRINAQAPLVQRMGENRAWYQGAPPFIDSFDLNAKPLCESKRYEAMYYRLGHGGSESAERHYIEEYLRLNLNPITALMTNTLAPQYLNRPNFKEHITSTIVIKINHQLASNSRCIVS